MNYCSDYLTPTTCDLDACGAAEDSVLRINPLITCGTDYSCYCTWDTTAGTCNSGWSFSNVAGSLGAGTCNYQESTNDDCADGFLEYAWIAAIDWPLNNLGWATQSDCIAGGGDATSCIQFSTAIEPGFDDLWHYDPLVNGVNLLLTECFGGSNTLQCPAQMQLDFFNWKNFIITLVILAIIYIIYFNRKKVKKKRKKKSR